MKGCLIYDTNTKHEVNYQTPKDIFGSLDFTTCGACIEKDLVIIHNPKKNNGEFKNPQEIFNNFVYDEPLFSPILVIQTNDDGNIIDLCDSFFL
tara:strand:+ start:99 stop:380 length:282 start_codon:yes stop_codon:yes gene_type:complete